MVDVYIAGSLLHVSKERWRFYEKLGEVVKGVGLQPHIPHLHTAKGKDIHGFDIDPVEVFNTNIKTIKNVKLIIADATNRSTGTGVEVGVGLQLNKSVICLAHENTRVSRMITGPAKMGMIDLITYKTEADALEKLKDLLNEKFKAIL